MAPKSALPLAFGAVAVGVLGWWGWRRHVRASLPGSVEPDVGGLDEAPVGSGDTQEAPPKKT